MAQLGTTYIDGELTLANQGSSAYDAVRFDQFEAELDAIFSAYAHAPVTAGDSDSIAVGLSGQQITPTVRLASGAALVPGRGALAVAYGSGRGIYVTLGTTAYSAARGDHSHDEADESSAGFLSAALYAKLSAIEAEATANEADDYLLDRAHHTGTQPWSSVYDFADGVSLYAMPVEGGEFTGLVSFSGDGMLRMPNLTTAQRDALSPQEGWTIWNTTTGRTETWDGAEWATGGSAGSGDLWMTSVYGDFTITSAYQGLLEDGAVTLAKMADMPTGRFLARISSGAGAPETITPAEARTLLNVANAATANEADSYLLDRANHTGTQYANSIYDFQEAVGLYAISAETGGTLQAPLSFTGSENAGIKLARLTTAEVTALGLVAADKGYLIYDVTQNRPVIHTPSGTLTLLVDGDGGDFLRADGTNAGTARQELKQLNYTDPALLTIDGNASITVTQSFHRVQPDIANGYYSLYAIYGGHVGDILELIPEPGEPMFTIGHGQFNIYAATGDDLLVGSIYDRISCIYDHDGRWRVGIARGSDAAEPLALPVIDSSALVYQDGDETATLGLDASQVSTGQERRIQSPDGNARIRDVISFMVADGETSVNVGEVEWDVWYGTFEVEEFAIAVFDTTGTATNVSVSLKRNASIIATATADTAGNGASAYGSTTSLSVTSLTSGNLISIDVADDGSGSAGINASGLVVKLIGYWKAAV